MPGFVVIVQRNLDARAFGIYRSFKTADAHARALGDLAFVLPIEDINTAPDPRSPRGNADAKWASTVMRELKTQPISDN